MKGAGGLCRSTRGVAMISPKFGARLEKSSSNFRVGSAHSAAVTKGRCTCRVPSADDQSNHEIGPVHPTRSAITAAGICGYPENTARMWLHGIDRRGDRFPLVLWRTITGHRGRHGVTWDAQLPPNSPLRQILAAVKMPGNAQS